MNLKRTSNSIQILINESNLINVFVGVLMRLDIVPEFNAVYQPLIVNMLEKDADSN